MGTGYGLLEAGPAGATVVDCGVIVTRASQPLEIRLHVIYDDVARLLDKHAPALLVLEDLYAEYRFPRTALLMAHVRGVVCLAAEQRAVDVLALAPAEVKRAIVANGAASKAQIQAGVRSRLGLAALPRPSHVADALALALTGWLRFGSRLQARRAAPGPAHPRSEPASPPPLQ